MLHTYLRAMPARASLATPWEGDHRAEIAAQSRRLPGHDGARGRHPSGVRHVGRAGRWPPAAWRQALCQESTAQRLP